MLVLSASRENETADPHGHGIRAVARAGGPDPTRAQRCRIRTPRGPRREALEAGLRFLRGLLQTAVERHAQLREPTDSRGGCNRELSANWHYAGIGSGGSPAHPP